MDNRSRVGHPRCTLASQEETIAPQMLLTDDSLDIVETTGEEGEGWVEYQRMNPETEQVVPNALRFSAIKFARPVLQDSELPAQGSTTSAQ